MTDEPKTYAELFAAFGFNEPSRDLPPVDASVNEVRARYDLPPIDGGDVPASPDDWIIRGVNGEHYPCKPDIFEKTYDPVVEGPSTTAADLEHDLDLPPGSINTDPVRYRS